MSTLQERLLEAESMLFDALSDPQDIQNFRQLWATLAHDVEYAISCRAVDEDTVAQYNASSKLIRELSQSMIDFYDEVETIDAAFQKDLDDIFARWEKSEALPQLGAPSTRRDISLAANWLSQNYHNPYPSSIVRNDISRQANWNRKDVDVWFTEARKRIGWNDIRKGFFSNRRTETVEKATQFFSGPYVPIEPVLAQAFVDMEMRVQELYPSKSGQLTISLNSVYGRSAAHKGRNDTATPRISSRSISSNSRPLSPISLSVSPVRNPRKRRRSASPSRHSTDNEGRTKRARQEPPIVTTLSQAQLLSPAASQPDLTETTPQTAIIELSDLNVGLRRSPSLTPLPNPKRRRNSASQVQNRPKYPSAATRALGVQAVSAPLPSPARSAHSSSSVPVPQEPIDSSHLNPTAIDSPSSSPSSAGILQAQLVQQLLSQAEIPQFSFDFPEPVDCEQPEGGQSIDLSLFSNSTSCVSDFSGNHLSPTLALPGTAQIPSIEDVDFATFSSMLDQPLSDDHLLGILPLPFSQDTFSIPPAQVGVVSELAEVDIGLSPFSNFDVTCSPRLLESQTDDTFFANLLGDISVPPTPVDTEKAKQMAHLEMLKKESTHLQERIQSLERQLAARVPA